MNYNIDLSPFQKEFLEELDKVRQLSYNKPITQEPAVAKLSYIRLEMTEDGHNKFWEARTNGPDTVEAGWGKIGKAPQGTKIYTVDELVKVMKEKIKKGYVVTVKQ